MSETKGNAPDLSALLGGLLSNPAAMSMLSSLLSGMGNTSAPPSTKASDGVGSTPAPVALPPAPAAYAPMGGQGATGRDERAALLYALRPFLPPEKCEMIDGLLRILDLLTLIRGRR